MSVLGYFNLHPFGKRIHNGGTDAVKTAGNLITASAEFTAGVKNSQNDRNGRQALLFIDADRNTTSVISDGNHISRVDIHLNMSTVTGKSLIDGVIDNFINKVMKSSRSG